MPASHDGDGRDDDDGGDDGDDHGDENHDDKDNDNVAYLAPVYETHLPYWQRIPPLVNLEAKPSK